MPIAYPLLNQLNQVFLNKEEIASLFYHDIFEYPLTMAELVKWSPHSPAVAGYAGQAKVVGRGGFFFLEGREGIVYKRLMRKRISSRKLEIAGKAARVISLIPTIKMVAVTGALAMENASDESDVDLMIVTKKGSLWTSRLLIHLVLLILQIPVRRAGRRDEKDKLCLNMWLDENDLLWDQDKRNIYTAHEIAQIRPVVNRNETYEKFIAENKWTLDYWPNAVRISSKDKVASSKQRTLLHATNYFLLLFEKIAFQLQYQYMKSKMTNETVTATRALFHPVDWSGYVLHKLST